MAATLQVQIFTGNTEPDPGTDATTLLKFNREDSLNGTTPIPFPQSGPATRYSWFKNLALYVTVTDNTQISNRRVLLDTNISLPTGVLLWANQTAGYQQASKNNRPMDDFSNDASQPSGYSALTPTPYLYDNQQIFANSMARNGEFAQVVLGVDSTYVGGNDTNVALPNILFEYDEE